MTAVNIAAGIGAALMFILVVYGLSMAFLLTLGRVIRAHQQRQIREEAHQLRRD